MNAFPQAAPIGRTRWLAALAALWLAQAVVCRAGDVSVVPLFDGERSDSLNLWGGPFSRGNITSFTKQAAVVHSGVGAYQANLGAVPSDGFRFFQTFSSQLSGDMNRRQDRDLSQYQTLEGYVRNDAGAPLTFSLELKDYRDSLSHRATRSYTLPAGGWTRIEAPLDLADGWNITGSPDLSRTYAVSFLVDADFGAANGPLYLDDFSLREKGPPIDAASAPIESVVERLARRQFMGLWAARNKTSGLIPNSSDNVSVAALNTTTGVAWTLPAAIRRGWVTQSEADAYMSRLVTSLNVNRDQTTYLPTRFLDLVTAAPVTDREESTIDASFIFLALHNYKTQAATPAALRDSIDALQQRFNFAAFAGPGAYGQAYFPQSGLSPYTYAGYTNENKVIALAGELSEAHHVPLDDMWNKDVGRSLAWLVDSNDRFLAYSYDTQYRAPFVQALLNLFVDTSERGVDSYPNRSLARNPWINFVRYQDEVADKLAQLNRENFVQPDAGQGAAGYQPYNLFNNFGQPNLFMPWSVAFALMAGAEHSEEALRFLLDNGLGTGLDGPLGLADSAQWATGDANPTQVPSFADNWNMTLSLMAFLEFLEGDDRASLRFAQLPEVIAALDTVFLDGDFNGSGAADAADLALWKAGFGASGVATPAIGDGDGDGDVDGADLLRWQRGFAGSAATPAFAPAVPEPAAAALAAAGLAALLALRPRRRGTSSRGSTSRRSVPRAPFGKTHESACKDCSSQYNR
ncbi:MAG: hypothetical protein DCC67_18600 [Planctomycetota bacterium]|nr:MAG: hypothetical protein DCC67_18600 [Planctomycetota bacterium]